MIRDWFFRTGSSVPWSWSSVRQTYVHWSWFIVRALVTWFLWNLRFFEKDLKWLVGGWAEPLWKMMDFVNWDEDSNPIISHGKIKNGNQTTNQYRFRCSIGKICWDILTLVVDMLTSNKKTVKLTLDSVHFVSPPWLVESPYIDHRSKRGAIRFP